MTLQLRRRWLGGLPVHQQWVDGAWQPHTGPWPFDWSADLPFPPGTALQSDGPALPFQPRSFRDFMLCEQHVVDASRGYVKRFLPWAHPLARAYEALTRQPFPPFQPHPLWYRQPIYYMGNHMAFVPSGTPIRTPAYTQALDYELELGFVLNKPLFNPTVAEATDAIGAFVVLCDFSARDVQRAEMQTGLGPQKAKHFISSMSCEALLHPAFDRARPDLAGSVHINGKLVAQCHTRSLKHSLADALVHAARDEQLYPGELFGSGTLPGGSGMENGHWLTPGCELTLRIDGVGELTHRILPSQP